MNVIDQADKAMRHIKNRQVVTGALFVDKVGIRSAISAINISAVHLHLDDGSTFIIEGDPHFEVRVCHADERDPVECSSVSASA